jgi:plastocyanin
MNNTYNKVIGWALGAGALVFVLLLGGVFSGALTDDPPAVNPYATGSTDDPATTTTAASPTTTAAASTTAPAAASESTVAETPEEPVAVAAQISIKGFAFGEPLSVAVGDTVLVTNEDGAPHTWTAEEGAFDSGTIPGDGGTFEFTFEEAGTFPFFCKIHRSMRGTITVES